MIRRIFLDLDDVCNTLAPYVLSVVADATESADCVINIEYLGEGDKAMAGDLIPTITLSLRRHEP